jgi:hypothetical protein
MLKMQAGGTTKDGKPFHLVILGLSHMNLARLKEGKPIDIDATDVGLPAGTRIFIFSGETEQSMARELIDLVGPDTKINIDPRLRD